jgi:hypothetical protein
MIWENDSVGRNSDKELVLPVLKPSASKHLWNLMEWRGKSINRSNQDVRLYWEASTPEPMLIYLHAASQAFRQGTEHEFGHRFSGPRRSWQTIGNCHCGEITQMF